MMLNALLCSLALYAVVSTAALSLLLRRLRKMTEDIETTSAHLKHYRFLWSRGVDHRQELERALSARSREILLTRISLSQYETVPQLKGDEA
jgi:hypothetical protein